MKSARGIYYDLKESDYSLSIYTNSETLTFYFSSIFLKKKYEENIKNYIENQNLKLNSFYNIEIDATKLLLLTFYKKIEKRGFRVIINGNEVNDSNLSLTII